MSRYLKYIKSFNMGLQSSMEYRVDFLLSMLSGAFTVVIQCFLWTAIYGNSGNKDIYGYSYSQMMVYTIMAGIVSKLVSTGFEYEIADDIKNGGLNKFIVQPIGYFSFRISCFFGRKSIQFGIILVMAAAVIAIFHSMAGLETGYVRMLMFLIPIVFALILNFYIVLCLSTLAFWMSEIWAVFLGGNLVINIFSGGIFPLDIFGRAALRIMDLLPFKYTIYYPVNVLNGRLSSGDILQGMLVQIIWILLLVPFSRFLWRLGMKKYIAAGG